VCVYSTLPVPESGNDEVTAGPILRSLGPNTLKLGTRNDLVYK
jgi:hypothetical protein